MPPFNNYQHMPVRDAAVLTTDYVAGSIIGKVPSAVSSVPPNPAYLSGPVGLNNQLILYVDYTKGSLTTAEIKIEFSDDGSDWYQETVDDVAASTGIITERPGVRSLADSGKFRIPIKINDQYIKVSIKGTGNVVGSSARISAIIGNN